MTHFRQSQNAASSEKRVGVCEQGLDLFAHGGDYVVGDFRLLLSFRLEQREPVLVDLGEPGVYEERDARPSQSGAGTLITGRVELRIGEQVGKEGGHNG